MRGRIVTRTISRLFDTHSKARAAVEALESAGFTPAEVSLVSSYQDDDTLANDATSGAGAGAAAGAVIGGGTGLLAALGMIAIPGIGPLVAAGVLATTLAGVATGGVVGGLIGALTSAGVSEEDAHVYAEGVRRGDSLVTVQTDETRATRAESILDSFHPVSTRDRRSSFEGEGWSQYDPAAKGYTAEEIRRQREQRHGGL
jgi:uncharacterized membrane protein